MEQAYLFVHFKEKAPRMENRYISASAGMDSIGRQ